jgi:hypothetical protein
MVCVFRWPFACIAEDVRPFGTTQIVFFRSPHDGGVDAGLRRSRRKLRSASGATSSFHCGYGRAEERVGGARKYGDVFGHGNEHDGYQCELERE